MRSDICSELCLKGFAQFFERQTAMASLQALAFLTLIAAVSSSQTSDCSYVSLLRHLKLTSDNELSITRPVKHWKTSTIVLINMVLSGILEVDEKSQTVTSHIWTHMSWQNEFLTWNSSDFCGINMLTLPLSSLWVPDITIQEDASDTGSIYKSPLASVFPSGMVYTSGRQRLTSTCKLNLKLFPFDKQTCDFSFGSMTSEDEAIIVGAYSNGTILTKLSELSMVTHGEWALRGLDNGIQNFTRGGVALSKLVYTVTISRKPMLYVINLIVPLFYLLVLDLASFFISEARGEKLSFKVTILLSISVLLLILQDMLPSTEEYLPMIASYCVAIFALVGLSVLEAMLMNFLADLDGYWGKKAQRCAEARVAIQLEVGHYEELDEKVPEKQTKGSLHQDGLSGHDLLKQILEEVKAARKEVKREEADKAEPGYYRRVAEIIDSVFFVLYFLTIVIFLTIMYMMWFRHHNV